MEIELRAAVEAGFEYRGQTVFKSAFGGQFNYRELAPVPGMVVSGEKDASYFQDQLATVKKIVTELGAKGPGDMGKVMGAVKARLAGKADMGQVSAAVKAALAG